MSPKTPSPVVAILLILGGAVFGVLGGLHAIYTLLDLRNPRRLVPVDPSVAHAMANSAVRLSRGGTDMWRAWIGFNFSHSLGVLLFAALAVWAGTRINSLPVGIMPALTDRLRLSSSRPALLVSDSCHRHCHWYRLLRRRMGPVAEVTRRQPADSCLIIGNRQTRNCLLAIDHHLTG
jgi:hypothetical protein